MSTNSKNPMIVNILYVNHRGEKRTRRILPISVWFGATEWHQQHQWLLKATDVTTNQERDFAMNDILAWGDEEIRKYEQLLQKETELNKRIFVNPDWGRIS